MYVYVIISKACGNHVFGSSKYVVCVQISSERLGLTLFLNLFLAKEYFFFDENNKEYQHLKM